jgi:hypothetical protein
MLNGTNQHLLTTKVIYGLVVGAMLFTSNAHSVSAAVVLLTDNFSGNTYPGADTSDINFNLAGRQGGTLATISWVGRGINEQVGNGTGGIDGGNYLLSASTGGSYLNHNFATDANAANAPLMVTFDAAIISGGSEETIGDWQSINILGNTSQTNYVTAADFGMLFRASHGTQTFDHTAGISFDAWGTIENPTQLNGSFSLVLSNTAGTGSAFNGGGTVVKAYYGSTLIDTYSLSTGLTGAFIGFGANGIGGIDNLAISLVSVAEPSSLTLLACSSVFIWHFKRRRQS